MENLKILCLSWNVFGIRICESMDEAEVKKNRSSYLTTWRYDCKLFDLLNELTEKIVEWNPAIVCIGFQEYTSAGNYAHNYLFPKEMPKIGYSELGHKGLKSVTEIGGDLGLKTLIYVKDDMKGVVTLALGPSKKGFASYKSQLSNKAFKSKVYESFLMETALGQKQWAQDNFPIYSPPNYITGNKFPNGGLVSYIKLPNKQILAILNIHLPFDSVSMAETYRQRDHSVRLASLEINNSIFNQIYNKLILESPVRIDHVIVMGDLNYRIEPYDDWTPIAVGTTIIETKDKKARRKIIRSQDELYRQFYARRLADLHEGVIIDVDEYGNVEYSGPLFEPTCQYVPNSRNPKNISIKSYQSNVTPSYCDRILYNSNPKTSKPKLIGLEYDAIDEGITTGSEHSAVYGIYGFTK